MAAVLVVMATNMSLLSAFVIDVSICSVRSNDVMNGMDHHVTASQYIQYVRCWFMQLTCDHRGDRWWQVPQHRFQPRYHPQRHQSHTMYVAPIPDKKRCTDAALTCDVMCMCTWCMINLTTINVCIRSGRHQAYTVVIAVYVSGGQPQVIGVAAFTFAFIVTIPSWLNEKKDGVCTVSDCLCLCKLCVMS